MFLQWCRDELVLSFIFVQRFRFGDRTRLWKGTTAETQTLYASRPDTFATDKNSVAASIQHCI
jgi:hypothetical protein